MFQRFVGDRQCASTVRRQIKSAIDDINRILDRVRVFDQQGNLRFSRPSDADLQSVERNVDSKFSVTITATDPDDGRDCEVCITAAEETAQPELWHRLSIDNPVRKKARLAVELLKRCPNNNPSKHFIEQFEACRNI
ncbi:MAG: hypothetical protein KDA88_07975 [Planctomycetaceae bacterium]|nr:hypothetical protein [Planctomycetaceae bacterium]MCB9953626.1 hypothetical protein [Planctomycetaceae bacterium]